MEVRGRSPPNVGRQLCLRVLVLDQILILFRKQSTCFSWAPDPTFRGDLTWFQMFLKKTHKAKMSALSANTWKTNTTVWWLSQKMNLSQKKSKFQISSYWLREGGNPALPPPLLQMKVRKKLSLWIWKSSWTLWARTSLGRHRVCMSLITINLKLLLRTRNSTWNPSTAHLKRNPRESFQKVSGRRLKHVASFSEEEVAVLHPEKTPLFSAIF